MSDLPIWTEYDDIADVLYVTLGDDCGDVVTSEDAFGLVWRTSPHAGLIGVTVLDFRHHWVSRSAELANLIARRFRVSVNRAAKVLEDA